MENAKYVIVGAGVAGTSAAATIRQHDLKGKIILVNQEPHTLYSRTSLVPYMRGEVSRDNLFLRQKDYYKKLNIELISGQVVTSLDTQQNTVQLENESKIQFEKLLIASGSRPKAWNVTGANFKNIYSLRTIDDAEHISSQLRSAKHVSVIGGGFITLELIQLLSKIGVASNVIIRGPHYWSNVLDEESGKLIQRLLDKAPNVTVHYNAKVEEVAGDKQAEAIILSTGRKIKTDLILANIGIDFNTEWLKDTEIELSKGVVVDQNLKTNIDNIYAAGDIALFFDPLINMYHQQGNWNNATMQGQVAGQNMTGHATDMTAVTSYSINFMNTDISFLGQTSLRTSITAVPRGSARSGAYARILVKSNRVVGATLINRFGDRSAISRLISAQTSVQNHIAELTDESLSLSELASKLGA